MIDLEQFFLACLHSNEKLKYFLNHNVNLVNYIEKYHSKYLIFANMTLTLISRETLKKITKDIDKERILKVLQKNRPDLYKTLTTAPNGLNWLDFQIKNFRKRFL